MQQAYSKEVAALHRKYNSNPLYLMAPIFVNLPLFMGMYWGVNSMCAGCLPSLLLEGLPWCPDLSKPDPYHIVSLAVPVTLWMQARAPDNCSVFGCP